MPSATTQPDAPPTRLPFPPITSSHILACSYHSWHPLFRSHTPKARLIPISRPFLDYLRADGIVLPSDTCADDDSGYSDAHDSDDDDDPDPAQHWRDIHDQIGTTITSLGGKVVPKLNWSAPKDATWISATNDMTCQSANDVYLLLKSSDFITHDLEHAFDGCVDAESTTVATDNIPYHLVLRKNFQINPALEFRCFVRNRRLIAVSQREMNYFDFLFDLRAQFRALIQTFVEEVILPKFSEDSFVFDVYIPPPHERVWLIDINPWAPRTDPLLFSWLELLRMPEPASELEVTERRKERTQPVVRLRIAAAGSEQRPEGEGEGEAGDGGPATEDERDEDDDDSISSEEELPRDPEFRLVQRDDPEAYQFAATQYSAHKLPRDVVDASMTPSGMKDMMEEWKRVMAGEGDGSDDDDDEDEDV